MNRRQRRANVKFAARGNALSSAPGEADAEQVYAAAMARYRRSELPQAEALCRTILERQPRHLRALVLLGDVVQRRGHNKLAVKLLREAVALDSTDASAHDTLAISYQALGRRDEAIDHFTIAIALGLHGVESLVKQSAAVADVLRRLADARPRPLRAEELFASESAFALGRELLLIALLRSRPVFDVELERLFTLIRRQLLTYVDTDDFPEWIANEIPFFAALAQQCFLNEYVYALDESEPAQVQTLRQSIMHSLAVGAPIAPLKIVAAACYQPLHMIPRAADLLDHAWPDSVAQLLNQQVREPLEEAADRATIPALTPIDDATSLQVQSQYEENPYPRWEIVPPVKPTTVVCFLRDQLGVAPAFWPQDTVGVHILVAGCGTGSHAIDTALRFPRARILAIDISRASLAFARRKSRALGLTNVEYVQADILEMRSIDRRFDVIEAVGVLHHLADPAAGWRSLLSLLRPNGLMFVGLYSALARRILMPLKAIIKEQSYGAGAEDIRAFRQDMIKRALVPPMKDFWSSSGCRDLLFHSMEHAFTLSQIEQFLQDESLTFLGFEQLLPGVLERFRQLFPDPAAVRTLACWQTFEQQNPMTFANMYCFWVQANKLKQV